MKHVLVIALLLTGYIANASNSSDLFKLDEATIYAEMAELNQLEDYVLQTELTYEEIAELNFDMISQVQGVNGISFASFGEPPLGIPSFLWGFCLGVPGLAIVYFVAEDPDETKKALYGCIAGTVVSVGIYFIWVATVVSTTNNLYY
jgi:hypothetical protein